MNSDLCALFLLSKYADDDLNERLQDASETLFEDAAPLSLVLSRLVSVSTFQKFHLYMEIRPQKQFACASISSLEAFVTIPDI